MLLEPDIFRPLSRALGLALGAALVCALAGWVFAGRLPGAESLDSRLRAEPRQTATARPPFRMTLHGRDYEVVPVAEYDITALVVSQNHASLWLTEAVEDSGLTPDVGVIWGENVTRDDYRRVSWSSGAFTLNAHWTDPTVRLNMNQIGNVHLLAAGEDVSRQIAAIRNGDQIRLVGALVNYRCPQLGTGWRNSSLTRTDRENGACEVMLVDRVEILRANTPGWYALRGFGLAMLLLLGLLNAALWGYWLLAAPPGR
jgi:hypothetical protein